MPANIGIRYWMKIFGKHYGYRALVRKAHKRIVRCEGSYLYEGESCFRSAPLALIFSGERFLLRDHSSIKIK